MADDFVLITPEDWVEIENATAKIEAWAENAIMTDIAEGAWGNIDSFLESTGDLPVGKTTTVARVYNTGEAGPTRLKMWVKFMDLV